MHRDDFVFQVGEFDVVCERRLCAESPDDLTQRWRLQFLRQRAGSDLRGKVRGCEGQRLGGVDARGQRCRGQTGNVPAAQVRSSAGSVEVHPVSHAVHRNADDDLPERHVGHAEAVFRNVLAFQFVGGGGHPDALGVALDDLERGGLRRGRVVEDRGRTAARLHEAHRPECRVDDRSHGELPGRWTSRR